MANKIIDKANNAKAVVMKQIDLNQDGEVDIEDIIGQALRMPGVHINREAFLRKELFKNHSKEEIDNVIERTPALAGIPAREIDKIADDVIKYERNKVSGISAALGLPGGAAMAATIPADIVQYYGYTLRAVQKLLYLYGFPEIRYSKGDGLHLDSETINQIILCLGIMNGVAGANNAIKGMAKALSVGVEKKLIQAALTKGAFYPFVKQIMKWFGVKLTKEIFAGFFKKAIPVVGGVVGGGVTYLSFKPCCYRLKNVLQDTRLSNPNHYDTEEEDIVFKDIIGMEIIDIDEEEIQKVDSDNADNRNVLSDEELEEIVEEMEDNEENDF